LMAGLVIWLAKPSLKSVWGLGVLSVMVHSYVDYPLRDPALGFLWFTLVGGLTQAESRYSQAEGGFAAVSRTSSRGMGSRP
jgi:hypothetical protein